MGVAGFELWGRPCGVGVTGLETKRYSGGLEDGKITKAILKSG